MVPFFFFFPLYVVSYPLDKPRDATVNKPLRARLMIKFPFVYFFFVIVNERGAAKLTNIIGLPSLSPLNENPASATCNLSTLIPQMHFKIENWV